MSGPRARLGSDPNDAAPSPAVPAHPSSAWGWSLRPQRPFGRTGTLAFLALILIVPTGLVRTVPSLGAQTVHALDAAGLAIENAARSLAAGGGPAGGATIHCDVLAVQATCGDAAAPFPGNATFSWTNLSSSINVTPECRSSMGMTFDAADGYVLLLDGLSGCLPGVSSAHDDTWEFAGGVWTNVTSALSVAPSPRFMESMVYDAAGSVVVMFGGMQISGNMLNDTWTWAGGAWSQQHPSVSPSPRLQSAMAYDPSDGTVVLFGGAPYSGAYAYDGDTWSYSGGSWTQINTTNGSAPSARRDAAMAYDPSGLSLILFGGVDPNGVGYGDTWSYAGGAWTLLSPGGAAPTARWDQGMTTDPAMGGVLMFGGCTSLGCDTGLADTWLYEGGNWTDLTPVLALSPTQRGAVALTYDAEDQEAIFFGGAQNGGRLNDTWVLVGAPSGNSTGNGSGGGTPGGGAPPGSPVIPSPAGWTNLTPGLAVSPPCRSSMGMTYDGHDGYVLLLDGLSGCTDPSSSRTDTWTFLNNTWTNLTAGLNITPTPRSQFQLTYDAVDGYVVLFGGADQWDTPFGDTWSWSAGTWTELNTTAAPAPRFQYSETFDSGDGVVLLFGGVDMGGASSYFNDTWTFSRGNWTHVAVGAGPTARRAAALAYDAAGGYAVMFGGVDPNATALGDTWTYSSGVWTDVSAALSSSPAPRWDPGFAFDPLAGGIVLFGGCTALGCDVMQSDTWLWLGGTWYDLTANLSTAPSARGALSMTFDAADSFAIFFGGAASGGRLADTWVFTSANVSGNGSGGSTGGRSGNGSGNNSGNGSGSGSTGNGSGNNSGNNTGDGMHHFPSLPADPTSGNVAGGPSLSPAVAWLPNWWWAGGRLGFALGLVVGLAVATSAAYLRWGGRRRTQINP